MTYQWTPVGEIVDDMDWVQGTVSTPNGPVRVHAVDHDLDECSDVTLVSGDGWAVLDPRFFAGSWRVVLDGPVTVDAVNVALTHVVL